jgi:hypothetical protein
MRLERTIRLPNDPDDLVLYAHDAEPPPQPLSSDGPATGGPA